jgi:hypothetical protein
MRPRWPLSKRSLSKCGHGPPDSGLLSKPDCENRISEKAEFRESRMSNRAWILPRHIPVARLVVRCDRGATLNRTRFDSVHYRLIANCG